MPKPRWHTLRWTFMSVMSGMALNTAIDGFCARAWIKGPLYTVLFVFWLCLAQNAWDENE